MKTRKAFFLAAIAPFCFTSAAPVSAQSEATCQPFTLVSDGSDRRVEFVDVAADGPGPGDRRIGYRSLMDKSGSVVGHYRWIATVLDQPNENGGPGESIYDYFLVLDAGHIGLERLVSTSNPAQDTTQVAWGATQSAIIVGGTDVYASATGTAMFSREGNEVTIEVDISCE